MSEKTFDLHLVDHSGFYGIKDSNIELIRKLFPKLKIIVRGDMVKVIGEDEEIEIFYQRFQLLLDLFDKQGKIENNEIVNLMLYDQDEQSSNDINGDSDLILYGRNGIPIKARTPNQKRMYSAIYKYDMMFCIGPAGTGKTYTAIALAVKFLKDKIIVENDGKITKEINFGTGLTNLKSRLKLQKIGTLSANVLEDKMQFVIELK